MKSAAPIYDDGRVACNDEGITIRWYYPWGAKRIPFVTIRSAHRFALKAVRGKWRLWGSGDFVHWYNLDGNRPNKQTGIEIDTGRRVRPCITPDDAEAIARIIDEHIEQRPCVVASQRDGQQPSMVGADMSETMTTVGHAVRGGALGAAALSETYSEQTPFRLRCAFKALAACAWRTANLLASRRIHEPGDNLGRRVSFADGSTAMVYHETVIDRPEPMSPAVLVVCFRLRHVESRWSHALFRAESRLNTVLFAGFPGLVSKLWLAHDQNGLYRGFYQWDDPNLAVSYVRSLWWVLALVSEAHSIHYAVLPGLDRDEVLADPGIIDNALIAARDGWWRPAERETAGGQM